MRWKVVLTSGLASGFVVAASWSMGASAPASTQVSTSTSSSGTTTISGMAVLEAPVFGTGAISGVVTDGTTGMPLEGVLVALGGGQPHTAGRPQQMTDARGRFLFTHLAPAADYQLTALKLSYLDGGYKRFPGIAAIPRIALRDGEWFAKADVQLWRTSSISGTVLDELNEPVVGVPVRALVKVRVAGGVKYAAGPTAQTDDRGVYRLSGLSRGEYIVHVPSVQVTTPVAAPTPRPPAAPGSSVSVASIAPNPDGLIRAENGLGLTVGFFATPPVGGGAAAYAMAYHPASRSMDTATLITLEFGEQRENISVQLSLVPTVRVSGRVLGPPDALAKVPVRLVPVGSEGLGFGAEAALTTTDAQGAFTFLRVPSGDYTLISSRTTAEYTLGPAAPTALTPRSGPTMVSWQFTSVQGANGLGFTTRTTGGDLRFSGRLGLSVGDRNVDGLVVPMVAGVTVSGHFLWDGAEAPPNGVAPPLTVWLEPADGDVALAVRQRNPTPVLNVPVPFGIEGVLPGRYVFGNVSARQFVVESIEWRGRDLLTSPLEIDGDRDVTNIVVRMSSKPPLITGSVTTVDGAASDGAVFLFPAMPSLWRNLGLSAMLFRTEAVAADGSYNLSQLVPGEYLLAAVPNQDRMKWVDPDYLASIAGSATRVILTPGAKVAQSLRMIGGGR